MRLRRFVARSRVEASAAEAFRWHERPGALERLTPPWERVQVLARSGGIRDGGRVVLHVPAGPIRMRGVAEHSEYEEGRRFVAGHEFTRAAIPHLAEALGSDFTSDRVGEATWALIERIRAALGQVAAEH